LHYAQGLPDPAFDLVMSKKEAMQQLALHAGPVPPLRFGDLLGLIGCPSFHGVMAVLTVRALWGLPVSGPLALAANIPVMLSIPANGGRHFVDVAGGILVAFLSAAFANAILRRTKVERHQGLASRGALTLVRQALHFGKI
jgi:PAP2 superfamily